MGSSLSFVFTIVNDLVRRNPFVRVLLPYLSIYQDFAHNQYNFFAEVSVGYTKKLDKELYCFYLI
ncbi:MAG: hypothetical protein DRP92_01635 [Candidatus Neomarinimicrobiota bacterium]|nr:MAG: hypothetical protein DRP92_01635 [Candidatus Neomarinimicrobiota bacterium]